MKLKGKTLLGLPGWMWASNMSFTVFSIHEFGWWGLALCFPFGNFVGALSVLVE